MGNYLEKQSANLSPHELYLARQDRLEHVGLMRILREIAIYASFLWLLYVVAYSNSGIGAYSYQTSMRKQFANPGVNIIACTIDIDSCLSPNIDDVS